MLKLFLTTGILLLFTTTANAQIYEPQCTTFDHALNGGVVASAVFDTYTTQRLLDRGGRELNPVVKSFIGHPVGGYAGMVGLNTVVIWTADKLLPQKWARVAKVGFMGMHIGVGLNNQRLMR